jgi:hypothetical protein
MAIKIKRSTGDLAPSSLAAGQLAYSEGATNGGTLYYGEIGGTVREIAGRKFVDKLNGIEAGAQVNVIEELADDTTPQLGGNLDVNGHDIVSAANGDINITPNGTGKLRLDGLIWPQADGSNNYVLKTDGLGNLGWSSVNALTSSITSSDVTTALGYTPENPANKGQANGYASLDSNGLVPSGQLPSYVDDVVEFADLASFPTTGETGKIYVAVDTAKIYRWSGTVYIEIVASPGDTDAVPEGNTNLYFTDARARAAISVSGDLSYDSTTGIISYSSPDLSGYLTEETDPVFTASPASGITTENIEDWNDAYSWGDHSQAGYITAVSDDVAPSLGGNLDVAGNSIVSSNNGNIVLAPNGTGIVSVAGTVQAGRVAVVTNSYSATSSIALQQAHSTADANNINFARSRGTNASPAAVQTDDELFELSVIGHDGSAYSNVFEITTTTIDTPSTGFVPSKTEFKVRTDSSTLSTALAISSDAGVEINGLVYPDVDGTSGQVLSTDGDGNLYWNDASAVASFTDLTDTPSSYVNNAGFYLRVTSGADGIEFVEDLDDGTF